MIKLFVSDDDVTGGSIAISWCVSHETLDFLAKKNVIDPQLIICVSPEGDRYCSDLEYRKVVPIKDLMTYIEFRVPGKNRISAFISYKSHKDAKDKYLSKKYGEFRSHILKFDGTDYSFWLKEDDEGHSNEDNVYLLSDPIIVDVPKECFATDPPAWEKVWVNHWFKDKPEDQCSYRRRRIFAYTIQPLLLLIVTSIKLFFLLIAASIGSKGCSFKYLLHPLTYSLEDSMDILKGGSIFARSLPEDKYKRGISENEVFSYIIRKYCLMVFMPLIMVPLIILAMQKHFYTLLMFAMGIGIGFLIVVGSLLFATNTHKTFVNWIYKSLTKSTTTDQLWYLEKDEIDLLVCDNSSIKRTKIADLPSKKRSIKLRFADLKSKVCRPFAY